MKRIKSEQCIKSGSFRMWLLSGGLVAVFLTTLGTGETVYEALGRHPDLTKFQEMAYRDEVLRKLLQQWPVTVFAPTDEAVVRNEEWILGRENKLVSYHVLTFAANKSLFPFSSVTSLTGSPPVYLGVKESHNHWYEKEYFVNNAKIIKMETYMSWKGSEQLLYIIDEILQPYLFSTSPPPDANELLQKPELYSIREPLSAFGFRVREEQIEELFQRNGNHTFFLPVGAGVGHSFNRQKVDKWVIKGHVIPKTVLFTRLAGSECHESEAYGDDIRVKLSIINESNSIGSSYILYAESNTLHSDYGHKKGVVLSKILKPNIPVKNGVVHLIESPLMIIDITVWKFVNNEKESRLSLFLELVHYAPDFKHLLQSPHEKTLFAPSNDAVRQLPHETLEMIRTNITAITNLLKLHLVMKSISSDDVLDGRHREVLSADNRHSLYFRVIGNQQNKTLTVHGGGVKAAAIQSDIGAVDGMVHIIDRLLGMPYQTVFLKLQSDPELRITYEMSKHEEWAATLNSQDRRFTFFVPSDEAWAAVREEMPFQYEQLTTGAFNEYVGKILDRHLVSGRELKYNDLHRLQKIPMVNGVFNVRRATAQGGSAIFPYGDKVLEWEGVEARILRPDVQAANGIIHVIDRVMVKKEDIASSSHSLRSLSSLGVIYICAVMATTGGL